MSSSLLPEILDPIVDHLHDEPAALKACCLVSKSWVPRTRRHLFDVVDFFSPGRLELWMKTFPDPSNSPACYTRSLRLSGFAVIPLAISDAFPWVRSFNHITELQVWTEWEEDRNFYFAPLHGLSPILKSLHLCHYFVEPLEVINLVCSFPLLENLSLWSPEDLERENAEEWDTPPTSPRFTGSLLLDYNDSQITRKLLDLPGGLHFYKVSVSCPSRDGDLARELVSKCSDTLESLCVEFDQDALVPHSVSPSLDLSKATKLKDVELRMHGPGPGWVNATLQTAKSTNLQHITIHSDYFYPRNDETALREWQDLDHLLVQLWTTRSILPMFTSERWGQDELDVPALGELLPEFRTKGGFTAQPAHIDRIFSR